MSAESRPFNANVRKLLQSVASAIWEQESEQIGRTKNYKSAIMHWLFALQFRWGYQILTISCFQSNLQLSRLGRIEIQCRSSLVRGEFLARYLCRRAFFWVSCAQMTLLAYSKDTLRVSKEPRYRIGVGIADTDFLHRDQPWHLYLSWWPGIRRCFWT